MPYEEHAGFIHRLTFGFFLLLGISCWFSQAQAVTPITPSGLNTQVTLSATPPAGTTQFDITGGTRPGGGANLFHSFGDFNVITSRTFSMTPVWPLPISWAASPGATSPTSLGPFKPPGSGTPTSFS